MFSILYKNQKARPLSKRMANADTLKGADAYSGNALPAAKVQQNSEITKLSSKKELPPVTPLGTNRRGISKAAQTILAPRPFLSQRKINQLSCQAREPYRSTKRKAHQPTFPPPYVPVPLPAALRRGVAGVRHHAPCRECLYCPSS